MKHTKKALLLNVMSLLLCVSMLVGTTFAWFTDSVSTGKNTITAGNLDIELYYKLDAKDDWAEVNTNTELFDDAALWEPGYTQVVYLKVANAGSLALKYQLGVNIISETQGKNVDGKMFKLSDYIEFDAIETDAENFYADRDAARKAVTDSEIISAGYSKASELEKNGDAEYVALVVYMPETVGNEANYREIQPKINLGLNLVATQETYEKDSFDELYDKNATYIPAWDGTVTTPVKGADGIYHITTGAELAGLNNVLKELPMETSITVSLDADINLGNLSWTPIGNEYKSFTGTFEGNGHTIYNLNVTTSGNTGEVGDAGLFGFMKSRGELRNLTLENAVVELSGGERVGALVGQTMFVDITNCHVKNATVIGESKVAPLVGDVVSADVTGCSVDGATVIGEERVSALVGRIRAEGGESAVTNNTTSNSTVYATAADSADYFAGQNVVGTDLSTNTQNNVTLVKNAPVTTVGTADELLALGNQQMEGVILLSDDIDLEGASVQTIAAKGGKSLTVEGNGYTISNAKLAAGTHNGMNNYGLFFTYTGSSLTINDLTVENVIVDATADTNRNYGAAIILGYSDGNTTVVMNDVDVHNSKVLNNTPDIGDEAGIYVGYQTGNVTLTGCDSTGCEVAGETAEKTGAFIGCVNSGYTAVLNNCTTDLTLGACNRVYGTLTINGGYIPKGYEVSDADGLKTALTSDQQDIVVTLTNSIDFNLSTTMTLGSANTESVTIKGQGAGTVLNLSSTYRNYFNSGATLYLEDLTLTNAQTDSHFYNYTTHFYCDVVASNVTFTKPVLMGSVKAELKDIKIQLDKSVTYYAMFIMAGSNVTIDGAEITSQRGIKIADEDVVNPGLTKLGISNATFSTDKKAAVLVGSKGGAEITVGENVNINDVDADNTNVVWVDEAYPATDSIVTVTGGTKKIEGQ